MGEIIIRNCDMREVCVRVNLPSLIQQERVPIHHVIPIRGLPNPIRQVVPLIAHIRSDPPHHSHLHHPSLVLAAGPGNPPAVWVLTGGSVQFSSNTGQIPDPLCLGGVDSRTGPKPAVFWLGWNRPVVATWRFLQLWLQLSI